MKLSQSEFGLITLLFHSRRFNAATVFFISTFMRLHLIMMLYLVIYDLKILILRFVSYFDLCSIVQRMHFSVCIVMGYPKIGHILYANGDTGG